MDLNLDNIRKLIYEKRFKYSAHIDNRMTQRNITRLEIKECILHGEAEIIEYYTTTPFHTCLVFGYTINNRTLHVVCSINTSEYDELIFITTYDPSEDEKGKWYEDFKTRRN